MSFVLGLAFAASSLPLPGVGAGLRAAMVATALWGIGSARWRLTRTEFRWVLLVLLFLGANGVSMMNASQRDLALLDFGRQAFVVLFTIGMLFLLRSAPGRARFSRAMLVPAVGGSLLVVLLYVYTMGAAIPSPGRLKLFKFVALNEYGIALNPLSFAIALALLMSYPSLRTTATRRSVCTLAAIAILLSGSRGTLVSLVGALVVVTVMKRLIGARGGRSKALRGLALVLVVSVGGTVLLAAPLEAPRAAELSSVTVGRTALWVAAVSTFAEDPVFGTGAETWREGLLRHLPDYGDPYAFQAILSLEAGGFHNAYLTTLAEKGIVGFAPALLLLLMLLGASFATTGRASWEAARTRIDSGLLRVGPYVVVALLLRGIVEVGGLLGYANGVVDYLSFAAAAMVIAVAGSSRATAAAREPAADQPLTLVPATTGA